MNREEKTPEAPDLNLNESSNQAHSVADAIAYGEVGLSDSTQESDVFPAESGTSKSFAAGSKQNRIEGLFAEQPWHEVYAEALLEENAEKLPELIALAERAILQRFLMISGLRTPTDEVIDLGRAVDALQLLKQAHGVFDGDPGMVA